MSTPNLRMYCGRCGYKQMNFMDLSKDPDFEEHKIKVPVNTKMIDPRNSDNIIRTVVQEIHIQKPGMICSGCLADRNDVPTAPPIWVGGKKN